MPLMARFLPRPSRTALTAHGRSYRVTGAVVDVPLVDAEAIGADQGTRLMIIGGTGDRPTTVPGQPNSVPELMMPTVIFDTDLSAPIFVVPGSYPPRWIALDGTPA